MTTGGGNAVALAVLEDEVDALVPQCGFGRILGSSPDRVNDELRGPQALLGYFSAANLQELVLDQRQLGALGATQAGGLTGLRAGRGRHWLAIAFEPP
jgi:hypothetical protein